MTERIFVLAPSICLLLLFNENIIFAQQPTSSTGPGWLNQMDIYAKVFAGVLTGLGTLFGLPAAFLHFRKTRAEIRKLELEAAALSAKNPSPDAILQGHQIVIDHSDNNTITILADPRFLGPLLLLLDFIIAWIVLTLAGYAMSFFLPGPPRSILITILAAILLVPIFREAQRVKKVLRPPEADSEPQSA